MMLWRYGIWYKTIMIIIQYYTFCWFTKISYMFFFIGITACFQQKNWLAGFNHWMMILLDHWWPSIFLRHVSVKCGSDREKQVIWLIMSISKYCFILAYSGSLSKSMVHCWCLPASPRCARPGRIGRSCSAGCEFETAESSEDFLEMRKPKTPGAVCPPRGQNLRWVTVGGDIYATRCNTM